MAFMHGTTIMEDQCLYISKPKASEKDLFHWVLTDPFQWVLTDPFQWVLTTETLQKIKVCNFLQYPTSPGAIYLEVTMP